MTKPWMLRYERLAVCQIRLKRHILPAISVVRLSTLQIHYVLTSTAYEHCLRLHSLVITNRPIYISVTNMSLVPRT